MFSYAIDRKKAAGRALSTLVEIVTFYTLRAWDLRDHIVIERPVPEFANPDIVHNDDGNMIVVANVEHLDTASWPPKTGRR